MQAITPLTQINHYNRVDWNLTADKLEKRLFNLAERSIQSLSSLWTSAQPSQSTNADQHSPGFDLRVRLFPDIAVLLGHVIQTQRLDNTPALSKLCSLGVELFEKTVKEGLPLYNYPQMSSMSGMCSCSPQ